MGKNSKKKKILCPNCNKKVRPKKRRCPKCNFPLSEKARKEAKKTSKLKKMMEKLSKESSKKTKKTKKTKSKTAGAVEDVSIVEETMEDVAAEIITPIEEEVANDIPDLVPEVELEDMAVPEVVSEPVPEAQLEDDAVVNIVAKPESEVELEDDDVVVIPEQPEESFELPEVAPPCPIEEQNDELLEAEEDEGYIADEWNSEAVEAEDVAEDVTTEPAIGWRFATAGGLEELLENETVTDIAAVIEEEPVIEPETIIEDGPIAEEEPTCEPNVVERPVVGWRTATAGAAESIKIESSIEDEPVEENETAVVDEIESVPEPVLEVASNEEEISMVEEVLESDSEMVETPAIGWRTATAGGIAATVKIETPVENEVAVEKETFTAPEVAFVSAPIVEDELPMDEVSIVEEVSEFETEMVEKPIVGWRSATAGGVEPIEHEPVIEDEIVEKEETAISSETIYTLEPAIENESVVEEVSSVEDEMQAEIETTENPVTGWRSATAGGTGLVFANEAVAKVENSDSVEVEPVSESNPIVEKLSDIEDDTQIEIETADFPLFDRSTFISKTIDLIPEIDPIVANRVNAEWVELSNVKQAEVELASFELPEVPSIVEDADTEQPLISESEFVEEVASVEELDPIGETGYVEEVESVEETGLVEEVEPAEETEPVEQIELVEEDEPIENTEAVEETDSDEEVETVAEETLAEPEPLPIDEPISEVEPIEDVDPLVEAEPIEDVDSIEIIEPVEYAAPIEDADPPEVFAVDPIVATMEPEPVVGEDLLPDEKPQGEPVIVSEVVEQALIEDAVLPSQPVSEPVEDVAADPVQGGEQPGEEKSHAGWIVGLVVGCALCLLLGGVIGAAIQKNTDSQKLQEADQKLEALEEQIKESDPGYGIYNIEQLRQYLNEEFGVDVEEGTILELTENLDSGKDGQAQDTGRKGRGKMGIEIANTKDGITVTSVGENSAAAKAGIEKGDVIETVNGKKVVYSQDVVDITSKTDPGDKITVGVKDKGDVEITLQ